jgi:hypothetical protein
LPTPALVPARGYAFSFKVHASFLWCTDGVPGEVLKDHVERLMPRAVRRLTALAAEFAREQMPHHARDLETALQKALKDQGDWKYQVAGDAISCGITAWIELDDRVRQAIEPYWEQLVKLDYEHTVQLKRADNAEKLSRQWLTVLTNLAGSPMADGAAELTETEFAAVVAKIVREKKAAQAKYESLLEDGMRDGDAFDRMDHRRMLLERLERMVFTNSGPTGANRQS